MTSLGPYSHCGTISLLRRSESSDSTNRGEGSQRGARSRPLPCGSTYHLVSCLSRGLSRRSRTIQEASRCWDQPALARYCTDQSQPLFDTLRHIRSGWKTSNWGYFRKSMSLSLYSSSKPGNDTLIRRNRPRVVKSRCTNLAGWEYSPSTASGYPLWRFRS